MRHRYTVRLLTTAAAAALGLTACSGSGGSGSPAASAGRAGGSSAAAPSSGSSSVDTDALLSKARAAIASADSVQVVGTITGTTPTKLDLKYAAKGTSGAVTTQGYTFDVIVLGTTLYLKAPDAFWKKQAGARAAAVLALVSGKYVKASTTDSSFSQFAQFADKSKFADEALSPNGTVSAGPDRTVGGIECHTLSSSDGGTLYVAKDDGRPVQIVAKGSAAGSVTFSNYGKVANPSAPPASQVVDLSKLGG